MERPTVTLHWLPLGAGGRVVHLSGLLWERIEARRDGRLSAPLFHSAIEAEGPAGRCVIEIGPVVNSLPAEHGVVSEGPVGSRLAGRLKMFRYELRCWAGGQIPDLDFEVGEPVELSRSESAGRSLIQLTAQVPMLVWGRDEIRVGEMWNSNSVVAWLLGAAGLDPDRLVPPGGGRAPGWRAGVEAIRMAPPRTP